MELFEIPLSDVQMMREAHIVRICENIIKRRKLAMRDIDIGNMCEAQKESIDTIKAEKMSAIAGHFPNKEAREAQQRIELAGDIKYQTAVREMRSLKTESAQNKVEIETIEKFNELWMTDMKLLIASVLKTTQCSCQKE